MVRSASSVLEQLAFRSATDVSSLLGGIPQAFCTNATLGRAMCPELVARLGCATLLSTICPSESDGVDVWMSDDPRARLSDGCPLLCGANSTNVTSLGLGERVEAAARAARLDVVLAKLAAVQLLTALVGEPPLDRVAPRLSLTTGVREARALVSGPFGAAAEVQTDCTTCVGEGLARNSQGEVTNVVECEMRAPGSRVRCVALGSPCAAEPCVAAMEVVELGQAVRGSDYIEVAIMQHALNMFASASPREQADAGTYLVRISLRDRRSQRDIGSVARVFIPTFPPPSPPPAPADEAGALMGLAEALVDPPPPAAPAAPFSDRADEPARLNVSCAKFVPPHHCNASWAEAAAGSGPECLPCRGRGACSNGTCACNTGFSGAICERQLACHTWNASSSAWVLCDLTDAIPDAGLVGGILRCKCTLRPASIDPDAERALSHGMLGTSHGSTCVGCYAGPTTQTLHPIRAFAGLESAGSFVAGLPVVSPPTDIRVLSPVVEAATRSCRPEAQGPLDEMPLFGVTFALLIFTLVILPLAQGRYRRRAHAQRHHPRVLAAKHATLPRRIETIHIRKPEAATPLGVSVSQAKGSPCVYAAAGLEPLPHPRTPSLLIARPPRHGRGAQVCELAGARLARGGGGAQGGHVILRTFRIWAWCSREHLTQYGRWTTSSCASTTRRPTAPRSARRRVCAVKSGVPARGPLATLLARRPRR